MISTAIQQLVNYGLDTGLILPDDEEWAEYLKTEKKCDLVIALTHIGFEHEPYLDQDVYKRQLPQRPH